MFKFIEFLKSRPKDKTIRIARVIFGMVILILLGLYFNEYRFNLPDSMKANEANVKYILFILGIVPLIMGLLDPCFAKRKYVKIIQIIFGIALIYVGNNIYFEEIKVAPAQTAQTKPGSIDVSLLEQKVAKKPLNIGFLIAMLSIFPLIGGITGKCITQKCFKHGEIITKIRV